MSSTTLTRPGGALNGLFASTRASVPLDVLGDAYLSRLRARLARECIDAESSSAVGLDAAGGVLDASVDLLLEAAPLVDSGLMRTADDDELVRSAQTVQRAVNIIEGARSTLAAEAARRGLHARRGEATSADTLVNATGLSGAAARRVERDAQTVGRHPEVASMLERGDINLDQAAAVAAADVPDEVRAELGEAAKTQPADLTRKTVRAAEAAWRQETDTQRRARQRAARTASMWVDHSDGMWNLRAKLDPLAGDAVHRRFVSAIQRSWRSDKHLPEQDRRSVQQRAADALTALITASSQPTGKPGTGSDSADTSADAQNAAAQSVDSGSVNAEWVVPNPSQMIVLTTLDNLRAQPAPEASTQTPDHASAQASTQSSAEASKRASVEGSVRASARQRSSGLLAAAGAAAVTASGTVLNAADARRIACDTQVIPAVMGASSEPLDIGRAARTVPAGIRRALVARDHGCVWPGCERAPAHCDAHHIEHWADGGPTSVTNLALLCYFHHQRLHEHNLTLHPPAEPAPPGEGWTVTPAPGRKERTLISDYTRLNR